MGGGDAKKGIYKECLLQIFPVTSQVAISHRVHRYKLALRNQQATRGRREEERGKRAVANGVGLAHRR